MGTVMDILIIIPDPHCRDWDVMHELMRHKDITNQAGNQGEESKLGQCARTETRDGMLERGEAGEGGAGGFLFFFGIGGRSSYCSRIGGQDVLAGGETDHFLSGLLRTGLRPVFVEIAVDSLKITLVERGEVTADKLRSFC